MNGINFNKSEALKNTHIYTTTISQRFMRATDDFIFHLNTLNKPESAEFIMHIIGSIYNLICESDFATHNLLKAFSEQNTSTSMKAFLGDMNGIKFKIHHYFQASTIKLIQDRIDYLFLKIKKELKMSEQVFDIKNRSSFIASYSMLIKILYNNGCRNFCYANFNYLDLSGFEFNDCNMFNLSIHQTNLLDTKFKNCKLSHVDFSSASISRIEMDKTCSLFASTFKSILQLIDTRIECKIEGVFYRNNKFTDEVITNLTKTYNSILSCDDTNIQNKIIMVGKENMPNGYKLHSSCIISGQEFTELSTEKSDKWCGVVYTNTPLHIHFYNFNALFSWIATNAICPHRQPINSFKILNLQEINTILLNEKECNFT